MFYLFVLMLGLVLGSFLNSVIYRLPTGQSILFAQRAREMKTKVFISERANKYMGLTPRASGRRRINHYTGPSYPGYKPIFARSHCPHCRAILKWFELIPVFSFIFQRGRCQYCGQKISLQYPLIEAATGFLFLLVTYQIWNLEFGIWNLLMTVYYLIITSCLIVIFVYDLKNYLIPDKIIYPAILLSLLFNGLAELFNGVAEQSSAIFSTELAMAGLATPFFFNGLSAGLMAAGFFLLLVLVSGGQWMGLGDVKLALLMGLVLGWPNILLALFLAFISGASLGLFLILAKKKTWQSQIPFGPFLSGATLLTLLFSDYLVEMIIKNVL